MASSPRTLSRAQAKPAPRRATTLAVKLDGAREVLVTGDFTQWSAEGLRLREVRQGEWAVSLDLAPGEYQYRLRVDGQWKDHPEARRVPNPYGTENCILTVG
jgi:1,4-alpha-glucan branching enzyme